MEDLIAGALSEWDNWMASIHHFFCRHKEWIPAIYGKNATKLCADCGKRVDMSDANFYAEFGNTLNHVLASRH